MKTQNTKHKTQLTSLQSSHERWHGKMRGAIMFALIFSCYFFCIKAKEVNNKIAKTIIAILITIAAAAQPTISPALAFGTYKHYTTSNAKPTAMLNINAGYQFTQKAIKPITELNILVPLENDHPVSFSLQAGAHIQLTEMLSIIIAAGPEVHIQQLYKYPIDQKDTPYPLQKPIRFSAKLRILKSISQDANTKLYTEISYDQHMPLLKFGMYITITKKY